MEAKPTKIEKGVPIPHRFRQGGLSQVIRDLAEADIGDSVLIEDVKGDDGKYFRRGNPHSTAIAIYGKSGWLTMRSNPLGQGQRVWKTAEPPEPLGESKKKKKTAVSKRTGVTTSASTPAPAPEPRTLDA